MNPLGSARSPLEGEVERRLAGLVLAVLVVWIVLLSRLFYLQVVQGEHYREFAQRNAVRTHRVSAARGMVLDRHREILVDSRESFDLLVVPHQARDLERTLERVAGLAGLDPVALRESHGTPRGSQRFQTLRIATDVGRDVLARVETRLWALPGVVSDVSPIRDYRFGAGAAHLLGWLGEISPEELEQKEYQGYRPRDVIGKEGIERLLDRELRGRPGGENVLVDAHGRELEVLSQVEPQAGHNVVLTLDRRLQSAAEAALDATGRSGAVVALDPRNGEVLVLASRPAFDPNVFARGILPEEWKALREHSRTPLHNRALDGQYPPGSTFKVVTALAGLEEGVILPDTTWICSGSFRLGRRRYRCWKPGGHGVVQVHRALVESCDVFFYRVGHELGIDRLSYYARALGLGQRPGIDLRPEASGLVPTRAWKRRRFGEDWIEGETISASIGQGFNLWTPLQMAVAYGAIGNGGRRVRPHVVRRVEQPDGTLLQETPPETSGDLPVSERSLEIVRRALHGVVQERHGTGYAMRNLPGGVEAAGKTGTAQVVAMPRDGPLDEEDVEEHYRDHAWFVTYVPAESPRIVVSVLVEHGGHGGSAAAPIAREVVAAFLDGPEGEALRTVEGDLAPEGSDAGD